MLEVGRWGWLLVRRRGMESSEGPATIVLGRAVLNMRTKAKGIQQL
jgi:hypothetical protein